MRMSRLMSSIGAGLLALTLPRHGASATEPYRVLAPSGGAPHAAVLLVPGCSGFVALEGVNLYDERASELRDAGYLAMGGQMVGASVAAPAQRWPPPSPPAPGRP